MRLGEPCMRISRIQIENFRNFHRLDVAVSSHAVIVGENKVGKSNLAPNVSRVKTRDLRLGEEES